jgi:hypothetical protein
MLNLHNLRLDVESLCTEVGDVNDLISEFHAARACGGSGVHRDPEIILLEIDQKLPTLRASARGLRDSVEHPAREA